MPSPSPSTSPTPQPQRLIGLGPFMVWSVSEPDKSESSLYALDLSTLVPPGGGPANEAPVSTFLGTVPGSFASPLDGASTQREAVIPFVAGRELDLHAFFLSRAGIRMVESDASLVQFLWDPLSGSEALLERTDTAGTYTLEVRGLDDRTSRDILLKIPAKVSALAPGTPFVPYIVDWYYSRNRWLVTFSCGCDAAPPTYVLDFDGSLTRAAWLKKTNPAGYPTIDGSQVFFSELAGCTGVQAASTCRYSIKIADLRSETIRTLKSSSDVEGSFVLSPKKDLFAYASVGPGITIARISDGRSVDATAYEAEEFTPVGWVDQTHLVAVATAPDLRTGEFTAAIVLVSLPQQQNPPPQILARGSANIQYLGLLK